MSVYVNIYANNLKITYDWIGHKSWYAENRILKQGWSVGVLKHIKENNITLNRHAVLNSRGIF
jgi:hypothetical protein